MPNSQNRSSSGNILFLILIAVALFAALSYAVSMSSRSSGSTSETEKSSIGAGRLLAFGGTLQAKYDRMRLAAQMSKPEQLYISNDIYKYMDGNLKYCCISSIPAAEVTMGLFHPQGADAAPEVFPELGASCASCVASATTMPGHSSFFWVSNPGTSTAAADLALWVVSISKTVCQEVNKRLGISTIPFLVFTGATGFSHGVAPPALGVTATGSAADVAAISGKADYCFQINDTTGRYIYAHILLER